ncbi:MAG: hypothetical protein EBR82_14885 [Caulobacteraceae bacterium]|nr:hypothetical protein [Caulobacteraceae bacterium]
MALTRTLAQLREEVRQRADMVNSAFVTNAEVDRCINQSWAQLYDRLLATGEDYYIKYVDIGPQQSQSSAASAYEMVSGSPAYTFSVDPVLIGQNCWSVGISRIVAIDAETAETTAVAATGANLRVKACYDGVRFVTVQATNSVVGVLPTTPTPTAAFATTAWSPALGANETINADSGVVFDTATSKYLTAIWDSVAGTARVVRFSVAGTTAVIDVSSASVPSVSPSAPLLAYCRPGFVAIVANGTFYEFDTTTLAATTTVPGLPTMVGGAAYDAATQRAVVCADQGVLPQYTVVSISTASIVGTLDSAITAAWAFAPSSGTVLANRSANPLWAPLGSFYTANFAYRRQVITSTAFADFQDFTSSNGQPATDVYQVRGVDAVYSGNSVVNLPRFNWEERNIYNATPALTPYFPIVAYRVIQNPITGNDCIEFIPSTSSGVSYYRVWYYPNPKVLTQNTDTIDGRSGWEEWVVIDAAMKLLAKEESDTSQLEREAQRVWARIMNVVENRDAGQGKRITDVSFNSGMWPYSSSYPRRF